MGIVNLYANLVQYFVNEPMRGLAVALVFLVLAVLERRMAERVPTVKPWVHLVPAAAWMMFALNEQETRATGANLRVDLLFTFPLVALLSLVSLYAFAMNVQRSLRAAPLDRDPPPG